MIATSQLHVVDNAIQDPMEYRNRALKQEFRSYDFGHCTFHGIAMPFNSAALFAAIAEVNPNLKPVLSFFRKSPQGQAEPHFIHSDVDMGDWSAILYLNSDPPDGDGTNFWTHKASGAIESSIPHERSAEGLDVSNWDLREHIAAKFNRLLLFPSSYFHSRALFDNWGSGNDARLTQVTFGEGSL